MVKLLQNSFGLAIVAAYLISTLLIGWLSRRRISRSNDFLNASRSLPLWVAAAAFLAANSGAIEIVGLSAMAAQYGVQAFHFYWIGAIPGMIFLSGFMLPVYMRSGVRSLPEYLERRFDPRVRQLNAWLLLFSVAALSGICLYTTGQVLHVAVGWSYETGASLAAAIVLIYVMLGGLRATIYNEVFQLVVIVAGLLPLLAHRGTIARSLADTISTHNHLWVCLKPVSPAAKLDQFGVVLGLGFVLSFSYWCTDFVLMQRALAAKTIAAGRLVPLLAGFGKLGFSLLVIVPALGAAAVLGRHMPSSFDQTLPALMAANYGPVLLGLGITALLASLMSSFAANISAFSALWTEEIYRRSIRTHATEAHYLLVGRISIVAALAASMAISRLVFSFHNLMEFVQLIFSFLSAPFFAIFLIGMFTRRGTSRGAIAGLTSGVAVALVHHALFARGILHYGSLMSANFYAAIYAFSASMVVGVLFSWTRERKTDSELDLLVFSRAGGSTLAPLSRLWWVLALSLLATCAFLNYLWR